MQIVLGVVNFLFFGVGTMIAAVVSPDRDLADFLIGVMQLLIPFIGWLWSLVWGILMILNR